MITTLNSELISKLLNQGKVTVTINSTLADIKGTSDTRLKIRLVINDNTNFSVTDDGLLLMIDRPALEGFIPWSSIYELAVTTDKDDLLLEYPWARPEIQEYIQGLRAGVEAKVSAIENSYNLPSIMEEISKKVNPIYEELHREEASIVSRYFELRDSWEQEERIQGEGEE
jgi:hypothetical protein